MPLLVLTHFHADHVDGLAGVFAGRRVGEVDMTRCATRPPGGAGRRGPRGAGWRLAPAYGAPRSVGDVTLQRSGRGRSPTVGPGDGSTANNATSSCS